MSHYAILRVEKAKSLAAIGARAAHNLRASEGAAPHADGGKRSQNRVLVGPRGAEEVVELARSKLAALPKYRKDAVQGVEILMAASPGFFRGRERGTPEEIKAWRDDSMAWLRATWGAENVISAVLHLDESTPHLQAIVVPIKDGKLRASAWLDGPAKLAKLQDDYARSVEKTGLKRGEKRVRPARHTSLKDYYSTADRAATLHEMQARLDELTSKIEDADKMIEQQRARYETQYREMLALIEERTRVEVSVELLRDEISQLEVRRDELRPGPPGR